MAGDKWEFWIDRGGTFTDIVAKSPTGKLMVHKLLSENPGKYADAPIQGIRHILGLQQEAPVPMEQVKVIKIGTTVATNALLERKGARVVLVITKGFKDALRIGYQNRPEIFALRIGLPDMLYEKAIEVEERFSAGGREILPLTDAALAQLCRDLTEAYRQGIRSCAIVLMHGYRYPTHEEQIARVAREIGYSHVSVSHQVSPLMKLVSRGDTTVADAYLYPILDKYIDHITGELAVINSKDQETLNSRLMFMQSNGGLINAAHIKGKDSILSGPAGGIVGAVRVCAQAGLHKIITFDMGGTSTDVAHFNGKFEREYETEIAGIRLRAPVMSIHTVAAGGGSILTFDGFRFRVGPGSAGAHPGPACYRQKGPLTVTDCNVMLGRIQPRYFPRVFGPEGDLPLDAAGVKTQFSALAKNITGVTGTPYTPEDVALGFLDIALGTMASAIKKISLQKGHDVQDYTLCCFGGAGGQHACQLADILGINSVVIHPYAGVLSAYGIGMADVRVIKQQSIEAVLDEHMWDDIAWIIARMEDAGISDIAGGQAAPDHREDYLFDCTLHLKYAGSDYALQVKYNRDYSTVKIDFQRMHQQVYGFINSTGQVVLESVSVETSVRMDFPREAAVKNRNSAYIKPDSFVQMYVHNRWMTTPLYLRDDLLPGDQIAGPAIIVESTGTNVVMPGWGAGVNEYNHLLLKKVSLIDDIAAHAGVRASKKADPVRLEIFNNLFRSVAEQMGVVLRNTASSVNIKERLDFSCAVFDAAGGLVANAPHIPVHLGSMSESVKSLINDQNITIKPGDVYVSNNPYNGCTHLPDLTVVTPVFIPGASGLLPVFFVASRGHHADVGGITPGSMPPFSENIEQEGILLDNLQVVKAGVFLEVELRKILLQGAHPPRNVDQNIADLTAQIAANEKGGSELMRMAGHYGPETVAAYMKHVQDNGEEAVRKAISRLNDGGFICRLDTGEQIVVNIKIDREQRNAVIDFSGTSAQVQSNFNAPAAVTRAAIVYVFRCLVNDDIPLNEGCLKPLQIIIPPGSMLNPQFPAAVAAGNVETSQAIVNAMLGALGVMAASQGTMNNFTFGNEQYQYYETICGGTGAGPDFHGTDAVHSHMTNSRLTDPEVLEWRYPILVEDFCIREGSGGQGRYRGGNGVIRKIRFLEPMAAAIISSHRIIPPFGLRGGADGLTGKNRVFRKNGAVEELAGTALVEVDKGDVFVMETPGGGGFGE